jgi:formylglycine-generating enzyme required for sulfatase activity
MAQADPATVSTFRLDKYLVTVGRFRQFVSAWNGGKGYRPPAGSGKHTHLNAGDGLVGTGTEHEPGWSVLDVDNVAPTDTNLACDSSYATWTTSPGANENRPMNCTNWWESFAFCIWDGGFLPSEAEWAYAAAGGSMQRKYPWGSTDPGTGNTYAIYDCNCPNGPGQCTGVTNIANVGSAPQGAGLWGQLDLAGEVWEWTLDYASLLYADPCTDCAFLTSASDRVLRGGAFNYNASNLRASRRLGDPPTSRGFSVGFRCARPP